MFPVLRTLSTGYGIAALSAVGVYTLGWGLVPAALTLWLGGALAVCVIAVLHTHGPLAKPEPVREENEDDAAALAEALARWEEDRAADSAAIRRHTETG